MEKGLGLWIDLVRAIKSVITWVLTLGQAFETLELKRRILQSFQKMKKTTAPRIPAWSPTVVLAGRHSD
jgi:hypothetical protein